jgi:putative ABC transport system substrate-binding protein
MKPARRRLVAAMLGTLAAPGIAAQPRPGLHRIGILTPSSGERASEWKDRLAAAMRPLGWPAGSLGFVVEAPERDGERDPDRLAARLLRSPLDVLVSDGTPATQALHRATRTIPIVATLDDPVEAGVAKSLARPGGNVTGMANLPGAEYYPKQFELMRAVMPGLARVGLFWPGNYRMPAQIASWKSFAGANGIALAEHPVTRWMHFTAGFAALRSQPGGAALLLNFGSTAADWARVVHAALDAGVPSSSPFVAHTEAGGLMSYSLDHDHGTERLASLVDKVLRGGDPASIPFELPTRTTLALNVVAARRLGIAVAPPLLLRADRVFETKPPDTRSPA